MTTVPEKVRRAYGSLPAHWRLEKLKFSAFVFNSNVDKTIADDEYPVRLCNYTDVYYNDRITPDLEFMDGSATVAEIEKFQLKRNQVIITKDSEEWDDIGIPALVSEDMPGVLCGYHLSIFEPGPELDGSFLSWLCRSDPLNDQFKLGANGVTRYGLGQYPMKNAFIALPPLEIQKRIAAFLDEKTKQIDSLIAKKQILLKLLAEKRQAIINQAVTKGFNTAIPMKDSGIEWLGQIPKHWELKRLCFVGRSQNGINIGGEFFGSGYPFVSYSDVYNNYSLPREVVGLVESSTADRERYSVERGDIFFTRTSETVEEIGFSSVCLEGIDDACFAGFLIRVRPWADTLIPEFSKYYFRQTGLRAFLVKEMNLVTRASLSQSLLGSLPVLLPPLSEQKEIASQITSAMLQIDAITARCSTSINQLSEYRSALITAAVTGKIGGLQ